MVSLSVVVPVYNTKRYLNKCVESILAQDFKDFELLLIDDGSTDESPILCDQIAVRDSRVRVFHNTNHGLAYSRNFGIENARGKYICFVDSDDYLSDGAFSFMVKAADQTQADIVLCGLIFENEDKSQSFVKAEEKVYVGEEIHTDLPYLKRTNLIDTAVDKLYKTEFLIKNGAAFPVGEIFEDTAFNLSLLKANPKIACKEECFYHYVQHLGSITKKYQAKKLPTLKQRAKLLKEVSPVNNEYWDYFYLQSVFSALTDLYLPSNPIKGKERTEFFKTEINDQCFVQAVKNAQAVGKSEKMVLFAAKTKSVLVLKALCFSIYLLKYRFNEVFTKLRRKG